MRSALRRPLIPLLFAGVALVVVLIGIYQYLQPGPNYDRIEDGLYLGGWVESPPWRTRAVLNLCEQDDPYSCEVHEHRPIADAVPAPTLSWLREQVEWIDRQRQDGRKVYVHCRNGVSRSGMVVTAYLMYKYSWTLEDALAFVKSKREGVRPNPAFRPLLEEWEREVRKPESKDS